MSETLLRAEIWLPMVYGLLIWHLLPLFTHKSGGSGHPPDLHGVIDTRLVLPYLGVTI